MTTIERQHGRSASGHVIDQETSASVVINVVVDIAVILRTSGLFLSEIKHVAAVMVARGRIHLSPLPLHGGSGIPSSAVHGSYWASASSRSEQHLNRFSRFCSRDQYTDTHTDHATSVTSFQSLIAEESWEGLV